MNFQNNRNMKISKSKQSSKLKFLFAQYDENRLMFAIFTAKIYSKNISKTISNRKHVNICKVKCQLLF